MAIVFPIEGSLRLPLLIIEWIFAIISLEIGLAFLIKYSRGERQHKTIQELGYFSLFSCLSVMWFLLIISDYFISNTLETPFLIWNQGSMRLLFLNISYLLMMIGALLFTFSMEKYRIYSVRKFFFTICFSAIAIFSLIFLFINLRVIQITSYIIWPLFLSFLIIYYVDFFRKGVKEEKIFMNALKVILNFLFLAIGFLFSTEYFLEALNLEFRLVGSILQLLNIGLLFYYSNKLPPLAEFEWKSKIEELFIINNAGISLYHKSYTGKTDAIDEYLKSSAISSINIILKSLIPTQKAQTSTIKKKGKTLNIYSGTLASGIVISTEELNSIKYQLKKFIQRFETIYHNVLINWKGNVEIFTPVEKMVDEFFAQTKK